LGGDILGVNLLTGSALDCNSLGTRFVVGADTSINIVKVYEYDGSSWNQLGSDIVGNSGEAFGYDVAMNGSGDRIIISAYEKNVNTGAVRIFEFDGAEWNQLGADIDGIEVTEIFGNSVDINLAGNIIIAGAPNNSTSGEIRVYQYDGANWNILTSITGAVSGEGLGITVSINGLGDIIAASGNANFNSRGVVRIYQNISNVWTQMGTDIVGTNDSEELGSSLDLSDRSF
jgi:hypothetical protein